MSDNRLFRGDGSWGGEHDAQQRKHPQTHVKNPDGSVEPDDHVEWDITHVGEDGDGYRLGL